MLWSWIEYLEYIFSSTIMLRLQLPLLVISIFIQNSYLASIDWTFLNNRPTNFEIHKLYIVYSIWKYFWQQILIPLGNESQCSSLIFSYLLPEESSEKPFDIHKYSKHSVRSFITYAALLPILYVKAIDPAFNKIADLSTFSDYKLHGIFNTTSCLES